MRRMTKQHQVVLDELTRVSDFHSAQQIFEDPHVQEQRVGLATVYHSLQSLTDDGHVDTLRPSDDETLYRSCMTYHHHHHLVYRECGFTKGIEQSRAESRVDSVAAAYGFGDVEHSPELFGVRASRQSKKWLTEAVSATTRSGKRTTLSQASSVG